MIKELKVIFNKEWFWRGIIIPIVFTIIVNLGLIFTIPNKFDLIDNVTVYLSKTLSNDYSLQILIGLFTVFVVFFTFAQFSYSNKAIPTSTIRKYIIEADETVAYLGLQFGFVLVLSYFSFIHKLELHYLNIFLNLFYLILSALLSVVYFFWLTKHIQSSYVFKLILNHLNIDEITETEGECQKKLEKYNKQISSIKTSLKVKLSDPLGFLPSQSMVIKTEKEGIVSNIDLCALVKMFEPFSDRIFEFIVDLKIGDFIPKYAPLPNLKAETALIKIILKNSPDDSKNENLIKFLDDKREEIEDKFTIEEGSLYKENRIYIRDLMDFYLFTAVNGKSDLKDLIDELNSFLIREFKKAEQNKWSNEIGLVEGFYLEFIRIIEDKIRNPELTTEIIEAALSLIYMLRLFAVRNKSLRLMKGIIKLLNILLYHIIDKGLEHKFYLSTLILYIKEVTIQSIEEKNISNKDFLEFQNEFYSPVIFDSIDQAITTFTHLLSHFKKIGIDEGETIIIENGNQLIDFLFPLNHWEPMDTLIINQEENSSTLLESVGNYLARNLIYLAIFAFYKIYNRRLPDELLRILSFSLADNCNTIFKYSNSNLDIINELIYDYGFNNPRSTIFSELFNSSGIHEYGAHTPSTLSFARFWIAYSFYLKNTGKQFIPSKKPNESHFSRILLKQILWELDHLDYERFTQILGRRYNIESLVTEYREYIKALIG